MSTTRLAAQKAPATDRRHGPAGLLICSHGVDGGPGTAVRHAAAVRRLGAFAEARACCLKGRPDLGAGVQAMRSPRILLVPLLMAEGHAARRLLLEALSEVPGGRERALLCRPVGTHPRIAEVLAASALRCCRARGWAPRETMAVVMGHGTTRCAESGNTAVHHARALAMRNIFATAEAAFLDQTPSLETVLARSPAPQAVVVGLFADRGTHGESDVPRLLAETGHSAAYAGPIGAAPELSRIILDQALMKLAEAR